MKRLLFFGAFFAGLLFLVFGLFRDNVVSVDSPTVSGNLSEEIKVINTWFPKLSTGDNLSEANVTASSAILVDFEDGDVIFAKNARERLPAASTIKMMTALVVLESAKFTDVFEVSRRAAEVGEDTMGLSEGERVTVGDLLYGLMLPSGNDAAVTLAEGVSGSEDEFVKLMNRKAKELGLVDTKFINASGLDVDGEIQYSTAYDLATIARYIWDRYPPFRKIASTDYIFIEATEGHKAFELYNDTNLLTTYPGVRGIKPGFTWEAGYCLVTYVENNGVRLIGVLLNSQDRRAEMTRLLDLGFAEFGVSVAHPDLVFQ